MLAARSKKALLVPATADAGVSVETRFEAGKRFDAIERKHDALCTLYRKGIAGLEQEARHRRAAETRLTALGQFREGFVGSAAEAELLASHARRELGELRLKFEAVKLDYDTLLGNARPVTARQGSANAVPVDPALRRSAAERFAARIAQYNDRVDTLKSSGVLVQPFVVTYAITAEATKGKLDARDYERMHLMYKAGGLIESGASVKLEAARGARGAAPNAPGVDYRDQVGSHHDAIQRDARRGAQYDR